MSRFSPLVISVLLVACSAPGSTVGEHEGDDSSSAAASEGTSSELASSSGGDAPADSSSTSRGDTGESVAPSACDPWAQDCPEGDKCMPYEVDPVDALVWDALGCFPVTADAKQAGDACIVETNGVSGIDDCELAAMCLNVDDETLMGVCVAMCTGTAAAPRCDDPSTTCIVANDGVILVCLPQCDPLLQDCGEGQGCYESGSGGFFCATQDDAAAGDAAYGEPCMTLNYCNPGLMCAPASTIPGCTSEYCCTSFCDASSDPEQCPGSTEGQICAAYFAEGSVPPGFDDVGVCAVPAQ